MCSMDEKLRFSEKEHTRKKHRTTRLVLLTLIHTIQSGVLIVKHKDYWQHQDYWQ